MRLAWNPALCKSTPNLLGQSGFLIPPLTVKKSDISVAVKNSAMVSFCSGIVKKTGMSCSSLVCARNSSWFNYTITLDLPSLEQRKQLIQNGLTRYGIISKINTGSIAKVTEGMSGALINELMLASAKKYLTEGKLQTSDITTILIQQKTMYSDNVDDFMRVICDMLDKGVSLRATATALGISHSTLEYQVKKYRGDE